MEKQTNGPPRLGPRPESEFGNLGTQNQPAENGGIMPQENSSGKQKAEPEKISPAGGTPIQRYLYSHKICR
jgi:hypothetical protein